MASSEVPDGGGEVLVRKTEHVEDGGSRNGFMRSEKRKTLGGECWRRCDPTQPSKRFGGQYEAWEFTGETAADPARWLRSVDCKPTRVDVAFDFSVDEGVTSDALVELLEAVIGERYELGISGANGINTRYIGSPRSEKRIRIYRKDLEDETFAEFFGPTLRCEVQLRGEHAQRFWAVHRESTQKAMAAASCIIEAMCGFKPIDGDEELPAMVLPEAKKPAEQLKLFIDQNGPSLLAYHAAGIDLVGLAKERSLSRSTDWKIKQRVRAITDAGVDQVIAIARAIAGSLATGP